MTTPEATWPEARMQPLAWVMRQWRPGHGEDESYTWADEFQEQIDSRDDRLLTLVRSVERDGFRLPLPDEEPIMLGDDGRVWSGHHRLLAARICGVGDVPVAFGWTAGAVPEVDRG